MKQVYVVVEDGMVQTVYGDSDIAVTVIDLDTDVLELKEEQEELLKEAQELPEIY